MLCVCVHAVYYTYKFCYDNPYFPWSKVPLGPVPTTVMCSMDKGGDCCPTKH